MEQVLLFDATAGDLTLVCVLVGVVFIGIPIVRHAMGSLVSRNAAGGGLNSFDCIMIGIGTIVLAIAGMIWVHVIRM